MRDSKVVQNNKSKADLRQDNGSVLINYATLCCSSHCTQIGFVYYRKYEMGFSSITHHCACMLYVLKSLRGNYKVDIFCTLKNCKLLYG